MADLGMDADVRYALNQFVQFVESGGAEGDFPGPLSILINHFGDNLHDFIASFQGSENFGQKYVNAINFRYPNVPATRTFLHDLISCGWSEDAGERRISIINCIYIA